MKVQLLLIVYIVDECGIIITLNNKHDKRQSHVLKGTYLQNIEEKVKV